MHICIFLTMKSITIHFSIILLIADTIYLTQSQIFDEPVSSPRILFDRYILCSEGVRCPRLNRDNKTDKALLIAFRQERMMAQQLADLYINNSGDDAAGLLRRNFFLERKQQEFCQDPTASIFLLDNDNITSIRELEMVCMWIEVLSSRRRVPDDKLLDMSLLSSLNEDFDAETTNYGAREAVGCGILPVSNKSALYRYIATNEWRIKVRKFREKIGCSAKDLRTGMMVEELHICTDRCSDAGIGAFAAFVMMMAGFSSICWNCLSLEERHQRREMGRVGGLRAQQLQMQQEFEAAHGFHVGVPAAIMPPIVPQHVAPQQNRREEDDDEN